MYPPCTQIVRRVPTGTSGEITGRRAPRYDDRMTRPMTKIIAALHSSRWRPPHKRSSKRSSTARRSRGRRAMVDSQGTRTVYRPDGRVITRETTSGNTTTIYDAGGHNIGRFTTNR